MQSIYVGNLNWSMSSEQLQQVFEKFGVVRSARVIMDRELGRSRGFGFVEMSKEDAAQAVSSLDGQEIEGRNLKVNLASDKPRSTTSQSRYSDTASRNTYKNTKPESYSPSTYESFPEHNASKPRGKKSWNSNY